MYKQSNYFKNTNSKVRVFQVGDKVYAVSFRGPKKWIPVTVVKPTGPVSYQVKDPNGNVFYRHVDHLRIRYSSDAIQKK